MSVKITAQPKLLKDGSVNPNAGLVITPSSKNAEYGTIRVDESHTSMEKGFVNIQHRTAYIRGKITDLTSLGLKDGATIPGKIIRKESFEPFYEGQTCKMYPSSHAQAGEPVLTEGRETYLQFEYTSDMNAGDTWVGTNSVEVSEEVKEALAEQAI